ncbi:hypothetical protein ONS95_012890 [Cadophora gregata]|uniref:uncharacterized protein n=1 Tax=Cadophora gregata TaxID=51156 RepID=UPI0026DABB52|nr:uncharacterized protein ONS95_012890 [Cadophora gregata]KAK0101129.1 hypothetical protein ONS96_006354 [Cadophora gregata f. sp. sojae]KAK0115839.1 hypothetical protein ONS95_012890 [Cadophora gregata]
MGRWGERFFEGDNDLDEASMMSEDAGIELYYYEIDERESEDFSFSGKGLEATRDHLNNGVLRSLFNKYSANEPFLSGSLSSKELRLVLLAALAMRVGATIEPVHMELLRDSYPKIHVSPKYSFPLADSGFRAPMKEQFEIALAKYKNDGTPYNFDAIRCEHKPCSKESNELGEGMILKKCGKCQEVLYCSKECQTSDWTKHKKTCTTPEKRAEQESQRNAGRGFISLNV